MAFEGGPNEIGKVSVGIEANMDALRRGLEQAKQEATQKAAEIQQALKINPLGYDTTPERTGPSGAAAAAYGYGAVPPTVAAEAKKQTEEQARANNDLADTFKNAAGAVGLMTSQYQQFVQIGQSVGDFLAQGTKQALELKLAIDESNLALAKSIELREEWNRNRIGGNAQAGTFAADEVNRLDVKIKELEDSISGNVAYGWHITQKALASLVNVFSGGEMGQMPTGFEQTQMQIEELKKRRASFADNAQRFAQAQEQRFTLGGIAGEVAGLAPGSLPPIEKLSPAQAAFMRKLLADNPDYLEQLIYWNKLGYNAQQQQLIEMMNGNRQVDYR